MKRKPSEPSAVMASIPAAILADPRLSPHAKLLFGCIWSLLGACETCFISNRTLAERMGMKNPNSIRNLLAQLQRAKLIKRVIDEDCHRSAITITWKFGQMVVTKKRAKERALASTPPASANAGGSIRQCGVPASANAGVARASIRGTGIETVPPEPNQSSAAREDAVGVAPAFELLRRGEEIGLSRISESKVDDAVAAFGAYAVAKAIDDAEKHHAESWGYVVTVLRRWKADDELPQPKAKPKPKPYERPKLPEIGEGETPLKPGEALAMVAAMKAKIASGGKP